MEHGTYESSTELSNRKPLLTQLNSGSEDLLHAKLSAAEFFDRVDPSCWCSWNGHRMHGVQWCGTSFAVFEAEGLADSFQSALGPRATRAVHGGHLFRLGVVEEAEHIAANAGAGGLGHVEAGCYRYGCVLLIG